METNYGAILFFCMHASWSRVVKIWTQLVYCSIHNKSIYLSLYPSFVYMCLCTIGIHACVYLCVLIGACLSACVCHWQLIRIHVPPEVLSVILTLGFFFNALAHPQATDCCCRLNCASQMEQHHFLRSLTGSIQRLIRLQSIKPC